MPVTTGSQDETDSTTEQSQQHELWCVQGPSNSKSSSKNQLLSDRRSYRDFQAEYRYTQSRTIEIGKVSANISNGFFLGVYEQ